jgi:protein-L-isoaspartate(D-aspartate) O-methyltransferase
MAAMGRVPRHLFVPPEQQPYAYEDRPLAIGHKQTISQPYIVALMTDLLKLGSQDQVLEIGTGSGYQAAVLSELVRSVYTIEIVEPLAVEARQRLARLGYRNVEVRTGDGYKGWEENAPFDAIMVTAGADEIPPPLLRQLKPGGRMVIPVGPTDGIQYLTLIEKQADGSLHSRKVIPVRFVPFTR